MNAKQAREYLEECVYENENPYKKYLWEIDEIVKANCRLLLSSCRYWLPREEGADSHSIRTTISNLEDAGFEVVHEVDMMPTGCISGGEYPQSILQISW